MNVKAVLEERSPKYQQLAINSNLKDFDAKKKTMKYKEQIKEGTEYVGVLLLGSNFEPVWVGNRIKKKFLYKDQKLSFWQTPTITPVAMSALAATCWMIRNKDRGGIHFPDDISEYNEIINFAEKYISKTFKLENGNNATYIENPRIGFNLFIFERDNWQYMFSVDKKVSDKVTPEILVQIANSIDF